MIILISLLLVFVTAKPPTLLESIPTEEYKALYKTLGDLVEKEYSKEDVGKEEMKLPEHEPYRNDTPSIEELNEPYSDFLFQGDLLVSKKFLQQMIDHAKGKTVRGKRAAAYKTFEYPMDTWTNGIPYVFDANFPADFRKTVLAAINFYTAETCIRFHPKKDDEMDYLIFINYEKGCFTSMGRQGGAQALNLGTGCNRIGVVTHELGHAIGMWHEMNRMDRDSHVTVYIDRVRDTHKAQYSKAWEGVLSTYSEPYEIGSIMHYQPAVFSKVAGNPSMIAKVPALQQTMGQRGGPSFIDIKLINKHYKCAARCNNTIKCLNGGYQNPNRCTWCKCPSGYGGPDCSAIKAPTIKGCSGFIQVKPVAQQYTLSMKNTKLTPTTPRTCNYILRAPVNTRIVITVNKLSGMACDVGCWRQAVEFKMGKNKTPTGMRFCCTKGSKIRMVSGNHHVPVMMFSQLPGAPSVTFTYNYIKAPARSAPRARPGASGAGQIAHPEDGNDGVEVLELPEDEEEVTYESLSTETTSVSNEEEDSTTGDLPLAVDEDLIDPLYKVDEQQLKESYATNEPTEVDVFSAFREN